MWAGPIARLREIRRAFNNLTGKSTGKRRLGRSRGPFINYVRMILAIFDHPYPHIKVRKIFQTLPSLILRKIPFRFST